MLGLIVALAELATPGGFYLLFFGVGAMLVGVLSAFGAAGPIWMQVLFRSSRRRPCAARSGRSTSTRRSRSG